MKEMIITFLLLLAVIGVALKLYSIRADKIDNGEMVLVNQNQMK